MYLYVGWKRSSIQGQWKTKYTRRSSSCILKCLRRSWMEYSVEVRSTFWSCAAYWGRGFFTLSWRHIRVGAVLVVGGWHVELWMAWCLRGTTVLCMSLMRFCQFVCREEYVWENWLKMIGNVRKLPVFQYSLCWIFKQTNCVHKMLYSEHWFYIQNSAYLVGMRERL